MMHAAYLDYWKAWTQVHTRRSDAGDAGQTVVITGLSLLGAAAITAILWATLKGGASNVTVPPATAP